MPSNHLILCHPLLLLPSIFPSIRIFSNESVLHVRWPKYWSFSFSITPSNEYSGLISFRMNWLDLLAVQGTLKSLLQHHSSKASILQCSVFCIVQLTSIHDYWKNRGWFLISQGSPMIAFELPLYIDQNFFLFFPWWWCLVTQLCPTLCDPVNYNLPGSSVHGILQARILDWVAISFFRGTS